MAGFVVAFNFSPKDYYEMTWGERNAIIAEHARINKKR